ncbi:T9SS type A sorting domain-containing protein [candidate division KSB1 bacterium]|nr:T9SS type A sorting domain-containing protein [candidate division KSB1 bacterium]
MKMRSILILLALLLLSQMASAQPFAAIVYNLETMLTTTCGGDVPIPDGTPVLIFWDNDSNGPDADDPPPPICGVTPPDSANDCDRLSLEMNGERLLAMPGFFYSEATFNSCLTLPTPPIYFFRVCYGGVQWQSDPVTMVSGIQEPPTTGWTCINEPCAGCPQPQSVIGMAASDTVCTAVEVTWSYPDSVVLIDSFFVYRDGAVIGRTLRTTVGPDNFSFVDNTASSGATYEYGVEARRGCGAGDSARSSRAVDGGTRPPLPTVATGVLATDGTKCDTVTISFTYNSNLGVDSFLVKRNNVRIGALQATGVPGPRTFHYTGASAPTRAAYTIVGRSPTCGEGDPSLPDSGHANDNPAQPQAVSATDSLCGPTTSIVWRDVTGETSYQVRRQNNDGLGDVLLGTNAQNDTTYEDATGSTGVVYRYYVVAVNGCGNSPNAAYNNGSRISTLGVVTGIQAEDALRCDSTIVTWTDTAGETGYQVTRDGNLLTTTAANVTRYADGTGTAGQSYTYRVIAVNNCGAGTVPTGDSGSRRAAPNAPQGVAATGVSNCSNVTVTWNTQAGVDSFQVRREGTRIGSTIGSVTSFQDLTAVPGTPYAYTVVAYNLCGPGPVSASATGTRGTGLVAPTGVAATGGNCTLVTVTWFNIVGEDSFQIRRNGVRIGRTLTDVITFDDLTAAPNTTYGYTVVGYNACGEGSVSTVDSGGRAPIAGTTTNLQAAADCDSITLTWTAAANGASYTVLKDGASLGSTAATTFTHGPNDTDSHDYRVFATNACGNGDTTSAVAAARLTTPAAPTAFDAVSGNCATIDLSWTNPAGATVIRIWRDGILVDSVNTPATTYSDEGADPGPHTYFVRAVNACGESDASNFDTETLLELPSIPTGLVASSTLCTGVVLNWDPAMGDADWYTVRREGSIIANNVTDTTYVDDSAPDGSSSYTVEAISSDCGGTGESEGALGTRVAATGTAGDLAATTTRCDSVIVTWTAASGDVDNYSVLRDGSEIGLMNSTTFRLADVPPAGSYDYTVVAISTECGEGAAAGPVVGTLAVAPTAPVMTAATIDRCTEIHVEWTFGTGAIDSYIVVRDGEDIGSVNALTGSFDDTGVSDGDHDYAVRSHSELCGDATSGELTGTRQPVPPQVQNVAATDASCENVTVTWDAAVGNFDNYRVDRDGGFLAFVDLGTTLYVDLTATAGVTYEYMVCANDLVCGLGPLSVPDNGTRLSGATPPSSLTASVDVCDGVLLNWVASTGAVEGYRIYRDNALIDSTDALAISYNDTTAVPGVEYSYEVSAFSTACGETERSNPITGLRLPTPGQVAGLAASNDDCDGILLNWTAIVGVSAYLIERDGDSLTTVDVATYLDGDVVRGVAHSYRISASNICGVGEFSVAASGARANLPGNVTSFSATDDQCFLVTLTWTDIADESGYYVYRDNVIIDTLDADTVTYEVAGDETVLSYYVVGFNPCGASPSTVSDNGSALSGALPATALAATADRCDGVLVSWSDGANATSYQVYRDFNTVGDPVLPGVQQYLDAGATAGNHFYSVAAINQCGNGGLADTVEGTRLAVPPAVTNLAASQDDCEHIVLSWDDLTTETDYVVVREGSPIDTIPANSTGFTDTTLAPATYDYEVYGRNSCGDGIHAGVSGRVVDTPQQVGNVQATGDRCDGILVTWDDLPDELTYDVVRDGVDLVADNLAANTTEFLDPFPAGAVHNYTVMASNACGDGPISEAGTGARVPIPDAPGFVIADSTCSGAMISWGDVASEAWYRIYRDGVVIDSVAQNIWAYADLNAGGAPHTYCVEAANACGTSAQVCDEWSPIPVPGAVTGLLVIPSCTADTVRWTDIVDETGYQVTRDGVNIGPVLPANATQYIDASARTGTAQYRVVSLYACPTGGGVAGPVPSTRLSAPATGPTNVVATDNLCASVTITWSTVPADSFVIYRDGTRVGVIQFPAVTFTDTPPPGTYNYCVRAKNSCGESPPPGNCDSGTRLGAPPIVPAISATENNCSFIRVTWTQSAGATQYRVLRNSAPLVSVSGDSSGYTDSGAAAGASYPYSVIAANLCGDADTSGVDNGTRLVNPGAPTGVAATDDRCDSIVVTWNVATGDVDWYVVFAGVDSIGQVAAPGTRFAYQPASGFTAAFTVRARSNDCGPGNASAQNTGTRLAAPAAPTQCRTSNAVCDQINVLWNGVSPAPTGYIVFRDGSRLDTVTATQLADTAIDDAVTHTYQVTAYNLCGEGPVSNSATGNALPLLRLPQGVPDSVTSLETLTVALAHCIGVDADTVYLSLNGGEFVVVDTLPGSAGQVNIQVPWTQDTTDNNRLRIVSVRGGRVDVLLTETFVILGTLGADEPGAGLVPTEYFMDQNFPNPFNPSTTIRFGVPRVSDVKIEIYDLTGRLVTTIVEGAVEPGVHSVMWDCSDCPTGMYLLRLTAPDQVLMRKMLLMK